MTTKNVLVGACVVELATALAVLVLAIIAARNESNGIIALVVAIASPVALARGYVAYRQVRKLIACQD